MIRNLFPYLLLLLLAGLLVPESAIAQQSPGSTVRARVVDGDTIPYIELPQVYFFAPRVFKNRFEEYRYRRLVQNVKRVYPYARLAGIKFDEYSEMLVSIERESDRRRAMRQAEDELRAQFESDLRRLTFSQGLILIKLVDRETKHTSYDLLKEFRGNLTAMFWQSLGRIFGYNLRTEYDPTGEDRLIEEIVQLIEAGAI